VAAIASSLALLLMYKVTTEHGAKIRWSFGRDLTLMIVSASAALGISQLDTLVVKLLLITGMIMVFLWRLFVLLRGTESELADVAEIIPPSPEVKETGVRG
jgi:hypothetical protein